MAKKKRQEKREISIANNNDDDDDDDDSYNEMWNDHKYREWREREKIVMMTTIVRSIDHIIICHLIRILNWLYSSILYSFFFRLSCRFGLLMLMLILDSPHHHRHHHHWSLWSHYHHQSILNRFNNRSIWLKLNEWMNEN